MSDVLACYGTDEPVPQPLRLSAGPLSCLFDRGALRQVCWHGVEVLRGVSYLLRDADWGTVPATLHGLHLRPADDGFELRFTLRMQAPQGELQAHAVIEGQASGLLLCTVDATAQANLPTNRCGFVVLHPAACAGQPLRITHTDGTVEQSHFPQAISPGQPAFAIRSLQHGLPGGVQVQLHLSAELPGDPEGKFEMEDQRNWSDASFKTYVASLLDPWPYTLPAGRSLRQQVRLQLHGGARGPALLQATAVPTLQPQGPGALRLPAVGIGVPPGAHRATSAELQAWAALPAQWWQVEGELDDPGLAEDLATVAAQLRRRPARVQLDLVVPDALPADAAAQATARAVAAAGLALQAVRLLPASLLKSHQPTDTWPQVPTPAAYAEALRRHLPGALVGGGVFTGFTELNRYDGGPAPLDFIGHLTWPLVHDASDAAVMQTLEALPHMARSVRARWPGLPYRLGPSTLAMRRNPYGQQPAENPQQRRLPLARQDPRHAARFGAAWTLGYAAAAAPLALQLLALHEAHGPSGPCPAGSGPCAPAWAVLHALAGAAGAAWVPVDDLPPGLCALLWQHPGQPLQGLLANLGAEPRTLALPPALARGHRTITLDAFDVHALP